MGKPVCAVTTTSNRRSLERLSLVVKLAARKFELSIFHQQKTTRKGWLFVGGLISTLLQMQILCD